MLDCGFAIHWARFFLAVREQPTPMVGFPTVFSAAIKQLSCHRLTPGPAYRNGNIDMAAALRRILIVR